MTHTTDKIIGVFIGTWEDDEVYSILYGEEGNEYLCSRLERDWMIVSVKKLDGQELVLADPMLAPDPMDVASSFVDDDEIVI